MNSLELLSNSPVKNIFFPVEIPSMFMPYGGATAVNVLDHFLGTPEIATQVENKGF
jgi:hypothetical protein